MWSGARSGELARSILSRCISSLLTVPLSRTTLEKQLAADALTPDSLKARQLLALGRRESK